MNYLDVLIGILVILAGINGYRKGLIHQLASLVALILGIYLAVKFSQFTAPFIQNHFGASVNAAKIISFIVIFIIVVILVHLLGKFLEKSFEDIELGPVNKIAGIVFSITKFIFIISVLMLLVKLSLIHSNWPKQDDMDKSFIYKPVESVAPAVFPYLKPNQDQTKTEPEKQKE